MERRMRKKEKQETEMQVKIKGWTPRDQMRRRRCDGGNTGNRRQEGESCRGDLGVDCQITMFRCHGNKHFYQPKRQRSNLLVKPASAILLSCCCVAHKRQHNNRHSRAAPRRHTVGKKFVNPNTGGIKIDYRNNVHSTGQFGSDFVHPTQGLLHFTFSN